VNLAKEFLEQGREALKKDAALKTLVAEMVRRWQKSLVEEVRERVLEWKMHEHGLWNAVFEKTVE